MAGAGGFLGSHLVDRLLEEGSRVYGLDNFSTGRRENLAAARERSGFTLLRRDLTSGASLPAVDLVFQLASPASPPRYQEDPIGTLRVNSLGTERTLRLAQRHRARFVLASTSEVYGDPEVHPQTESYWGHVNPIGPRSCYDEGKRYAEALASAYARAKGVDVRIARIFNTYGPRMALDDGRVISNFLVQAIRGEPLTVQGTGKQSRSFCFVSDMVEGLYRLARTDPGTLPGPVNLGNPRGEVSIGELAELVRELTGNRSAVRRIPRAVDDPERRRPDIRRARRFLGWSPRVPLRVGLERTVEDFRSRLEEA